MHISKRLFSGLAISAWITILAVSSCSMPTPALGPTQPVTSTAPITVISVTPVLVETDTPGIPLPTSQLEFTPTFTSTVTATYTPATTGTISADCDRAEFGTDVTYLDGSAVNAKEDMIKTWRIKNVGSCTWDDKYKLVFIRGEQMTAPSPADVISSPVAPGASVDLSIPMKAPEINGIHWGVWQLFNAAGKPVLKADGTPEELTIQVNILNGQGGKVTSILGWTYTYVGTKCSGDVQYDITTSIYADGPVSINYTWSAANGLLTVVSQNFVFSSAGNIAVTTHLSPPYADPSNIRLTLTANGSYSSSFTICP